MLTIIGTGHVFNIADPIVFIIKHSWPQAVCVELDKLRYDAITGNTEAVKAELARREASGERTAPVYEQSGRYQKRISSQNDVQAGADMAAAISAAKALGAEVFCVDVDAREALTRMWDEMPRTERTRYRLSQVSDRIGGRRKVDRVQKQYSGDEEAYMESFRRKYPTLVRVLIDERNEHMASEIRKVCSAHGDVVAVMGDGHVSGVTKLLSDVPMRVVRLADLSDPERLAKVKTQIWNGDEE